MKKAFTSKNNFKILLGTFLLICACLFVGCAKTVGEDIFRFEVRELELIVGEKQDLKLVLGTIEEGTIRAEVSKTETPVLNIIKSEIQVGEKLSIEAVGEGSVRLTVYVVSDEANISDTITVNVSKKKLSAFKAEPEKDVLNIGDTTQFTITTYPNDLSEVNKVTYTSSNPEVGTISETGLFTAVFPGETIISVTSLYDNTKVALKKMEVVYNATEEIKVEEENVSMLWKETNQIVTTVLPNVLPNFANPAVTYVSSDEKVLKVDENGLVTAVGVGEATITVKSVDNVEKVVNYTVAYAAIVDLTVDAETVDLLWKDTHQIAATLIPENADPNLTYVSSNEEVVKVTNAGKVTAAGVGEATVTVTTTDGKEKVITFKVTYPKLEGFTVKSGRDELKTDKPFEVKVDKQLTLTITLNPTNAEPLTAVIEVEDPTILSVDGLNIKALAVGQTTITITVGEISKTITINVIAK